MSIQKMMALHADMQGVRTDALATAARHAVLCDLMCISCADACGAEDMDMRQCIRVCLDCADVCVATARLAVRRTGRNVSMLQLMLESCATICDCCGKECGQHALGHCQLCAQMCHECARDCRAVIPELS